MNRKTSALNITGANAKGVAKEVFNSYYELSRIGEGAKHVSTVDQDRYLNMSYMDINRTFLADTFADMVDSSVKNVSGKHSPRYNTWDKITIPANYFYDGQKEITSTLGRFIINKFVLQGAGLISISGYKDIVFKKSSLGDLDNDVGQYYLENKIDRNTFNLYLDRRDTLGYWTNGMLAHTISERMLKPLPEVEKKKAELIEKYKDELDAGNIDIMTKISDELIAYAKDILKGDPGMDLYDSGDLDFNNNYKNNSILKGAVMNKITNEYDFIGSSFMDGIEIKDIPAHANSILASQYPASIATKDAGYLGKKLLALLQMMEIDEEGTDCGTKNLIPVKITKSNKSNMVYSYINSDGQLLMLDNSNINQYVGKTVMMRSPMSCINEKICSKCAGQLFYLLGAKHAGLFATQISHADLNLALKAKHNSCIDLYTLDPDLILEDI